MYSGKRTLSFLIFFIKSWMQGAGADGVTLENLQDMYKNSTPGYQICYFDGSYCTRGQAYCSRKSKTCTSLFPKDASEETKLATCKDIIRRNEAEPGVYDTCVYFFGRLEIRRVLGKNKEDHTDDNNPKQDPGKELCRYPDTYCQLGYEFCNITNGNCEPLFSPNASDTEKRQRCVQVIRTNMTMLRDACTHALGKLSFSEFFEKHTEEHSDDKHPIQAPGKELCRYPDTYCQLGYEFCNITNGNCEPLFSPNASDTEKRQRCVQVIRTKMTMLRDACTYALGKMSFCESTVTDKKAADQANDYIIWGAIVTVVLVIGVIAFVVFIKCKKLLCFKETQPPTAPTVPPPAQAVPKRLRIRIRKYGGVIPLEQQRSLTEQEQDGTSTEQVQDGTSSEEELD